MRSTLGRSGDTDGSGGDPNRADDVRRPGGSVPGTAPGEASLAHTGTGEGQPGSTDQLLLLGLTRRAALADTVIMLMYLVVAGMACRAWYFAHAGGPNVDLFATWLLPWLMAGVGGLALVALVTRHADLGGAALGLSGDAVAGQVVWGLGGAILACVGLLGWIALEWTVRSVLRSIGVGVPWSWEATYRFAEGLRGVSIGTIFVTMGAGAVVEEAVFRGVILPRLRRVTGQWWSAILLNVLLFGAQHFAGGFVAIVGTAIVSTVFCVVFIRSRSLGAAVVAHFLYNLLQCVIGRWQSGGG